MNSDKLPLDGLRVLDFSTLLPGPLAGLMLADAGAEVIKIEPPQGDPMRWMPPLWGDASAVFALLNRGKKSICLDLKNDAGREALKPLVAQADILIEQFRPGVMARFGLGYEHLREQNPRLIYCSITGYGQWGPKAGEAGHDLNYVGDTGLLALSPGPSHCPVIPPVLSADIAGGSYPAVINILLALFLRQQSGQGRHLDISMSDNLFTLGFAGLAQGFATGDWPGPADLLLTGGSPRYQLYPTSDGQLLALGALEDKFWAAFCQAIDLVDDLRDDARNPAATGNAVVGVIAGKPAAHWRAVFTKVDCCCTLVESLEDAVKNPHFVSRGLFQRQLRNAARDVMPALPLPLADAFRGASDTALRAPALGQHNKEFLPSADND